MTATRIALAMLLLAGGAGAAFASEEREQACAVAAPADGSKPASLSQDEIRAKLAAEGFTEIRSLGQEDGCFEAKGIDKSGNRFEVYAHPVTGAIIGRK